MEVRKRINPRNDAIPKRGEGVGSRHGQGQQEDFVGDVDEV